MRLKGESIQEHIKTMMELFSELAIVGDAIEEEDQVVYLLATLPDSFSTLVAALEVSKEVPKIETVTERLLHAEKTQKEKTSVEVDKGNCPECVKGTQEFRPKDSGYKAISVKIGLVKHSLLKAEESTHH